MIRAGFSSPTLSLPFLEVSVPFHHMDSNFPQRVPLLQRWADPAALSNCFLHSEPSETQRPLFSRLFQVVAAKLL